MNKIPITFYALLLLLCSCSSPSTDSRPKEKLSVILQIIPEGEDTYSISWKDSIGRKEFNGIPNRPVELWCHVKNSKNDTIGHYRGANIPKDYLVFSTKESSIKVQFSKNVNRSSNLFSDTDLLRSYLEDQGNFMEFQALEIEIKDYLWKEKFVQIKAP